ncbi:MAG: glucose 1-dehydrogenase [Mesorhizobium sp.]|nr:MAG: glucose 1-dehydrogenase [Mesorhizobium sp.]
MPSRKTAIVTGSTSGIGLAIAHALAAEGYNVVVNSFSDTADDRAITDAIAKHHKVKAAYIKADMSKPAECRALVAKAAETFGSVDILVNNAGIQHVAPVEEFPIEKWDAIIAINLSSAFHTIAAAIPLMREAGGGRIVNIASIAGKEGNPNASAYSTSKAAVIGLTKSLGKELAKTKVTVNCVTPAAVRTAIFQQMSQQHIDFMLSKIPMARFGEVEEVAALISWIASEECSFTTAAVFDVSGGRATY